MFKSFLCWFALLTLATSTTAFTVPSVANTRGASVSRRRSSSATLARFMSEPPEQPRPAATAATASEEERTEEIDPMEAEMEMMDDETRKALEKSRRADELRAQEVFMQKSTGKHKCTNCDWEYDEEKGDSMMIGGTIKPGTAFADLPSNWRCPVCRASKDSFQEVVEEIPGFEVNQKYGFGTNSWTSGQKNLAIFGGLAGFFLLFLSGYALN